MDNQLAGDAVAGLERLPHRVLTALEVADFVGATRKPGGVVGQNDPN